MNNNNNNNNNNRISKKFQSVNFDNPNNDFLKDI